MSNTDMDQPRLGPTKPKFRPILGAGIAKGMTLDEFFAKVKFPVYASPKFDGIRCILMDEPVLRTHYRCFPACRSLGRIPNNHVFEHLTKLPPGLDGELITLEHQDLLNNGSKPLPFYQIQTDIMSISGVPNWEYHVFDYHPFSAKHPWLERYDDRLQCLRELLPELFMQCPGRVKLVEQVLITNLEDLMAYEVKCIERGYEGICWRKDDARYKYGRSTLNEQHLVKLKRFIDAEAEIIGVEELLRNTNAPTTNALGYQERSSHSANMVPAGTLGKLVCRTPAGEEFRIGSGFTQAQRDELWQRGEALIGQLVKYKHQSHGQKDKPRIPIFISLRDRRDT